MENWFRLAITAVLTAVTWALGSLWMSYTSYTYAKLHLFLLVPLFLLMFLPPRPLSNAHPVVQYFGYGTTVILSVVAVVFSGLTWDTLLWKEGVLHIYTGTMGEIIGLPYEEAFWCVDHTFFAAFWVMSIWRSTPVTEKPEGS